MSGGSIRRSRRRNSIVTMVLLIGGLIVIAIPYLWILLTAFKRPVDAASVPPEIFSPTTIANFQAVFKGPYLGSLANSVIDHRAHDGRDPHLRGAGGLRVRPRAVHRAAIPGGLAAVQPDGPAGRSSSSPCSCSSISCT